jgi:hypothetical protein
MTKNDSRADRNADATIRVRGGDAAADHPGACGGDDNGDEPAASVTAARTSEDGATAEATSDAEDGTPAPGATPGAGTSPSASLPTAGRTVTADEAAAILDAIVLKPADIAGEWSIQNDTTTDNEAAAAQSPDQAPSIERCGRLLGRTVVLQPTDTVTRYIGGQAVSFFTNATVFATPQGAGDRRPRPRRDSRTRANCGSPAACSCARRGHRDVGAFPAMGDGSFAVTLST